MAGAPGHNGGLTPFPPSILHRSTRLTHQQAHAHLSAFLSLAENSAAYRPDSTLTTRGPQSASTTVSGASATEQSNLTLHHLSRILKGIEGRRVLPPKLKNIDDDHNKTKEGGGGEWQEKEDYDLAQQQENQTVEVMAEERHPGAHLEEPTDEQEADRMVEIEIEDSQEKVGLAGQRAITTQSQADKQSRKDAKKNRRKLEKRAKEDAKANR